MFRTDLRLALRRLRQHPAIAALNVTGLALGLACCLLIVLFVADELSFDRTHPEADRLYRVEAEVEGADGPERWASVLLNVAYDVVPQVPGIEAETRVTGRGDPLVTRGENRFYEDRFVYAEPTFFDLFDTRIVRGDAAELDRPNTVVLSEPTAARYFGRDNPVGQTIEVRDRYDVGVDTFEVVGVMTELPHNAHLQADFLASFVSSLPDDPARRASRLAHTYVRLGQGTDPEAATARLNEAYERMADDGGPRLGGALHLAPVTDIRLRSAAAPDSEFEPQGDIRYVWLFSAIALVILLLAGVNYTNLATARGAQRTTEVGVRKALGADRRQLRRLFLSESLVVTVAAAGLALGLVAVALPAFGAWMGRPLSLPFADPAFWAVFAAAVVALAVGAGSYPAFVLAALQPTSALKADGRFASRTTLRKVLLVGQFAATIALVACSIGIQRQLHYVQNTRLGFEADGVLVLRTRGALGESRTAFETEAERIPGVEAVAFGTGVPGEPTGIGFFESGDVEGQEGGEEWISFDRLDVGPDFASVLELDVVEGRGFSADFAGDASEAVLVNEAAAREWGWTDPIGKTIGAGDEQRRVVGVVRDVHLKDMREAVGPLVMYADPNVTSYAVVRLRADGLPATMAALEGAWADVAPDQLFDAFFLDDHFAAFYRAERVVGQVFLAFTGLAIVVACLGLFGLAMLMAQQRTREVGIRKVLGASVTSLVALLSREFALLVGVAFVVAVPAAYVFLQDWLDDFVYRAEPTAGLFLGAGALTLAIALATVGAHALRAATADPVQALRSE